MKSLGKTWGKNIYGSMKLTSDVTWGMVRGRQEKQFCLIWAVKKIKVDELSYCNRSPCTSRRRHSSLRCSWTRRGWTSAVQFYFFTVFSCLGICSRELITWSDHVAWSFLLLSDHVAWSFLLLSISVSGTESARTPRIILANTDGERGCLCIFLHAVVCVLSLLPLDCNQPQCSPSLSPGLSDEGSIHYYCNVCLGTADCLFL